MKKKRLVFRSVLLAIILLAIGYTIYNSIYEKSGTYVSEGEMAPNFVLTDLKGNRVELSDYRGKGVFLNFWGTWCKPCEREMPFMERQYKTFKKQGVEILAVNVSETNLSVKNFADRYGLTFQIPMDKDREVTKAYGIGPIPTTVLIDKNGKVVGRTSESLSTKKIVSFMEKIKP
ncbi:thiol-disulfide oxidoreductase ResA [Fictibacillus barbaricus]|uniref:Peroxiredoxin n=1 Tax=Fictibacillus barbaricus TaxID=182136 RepID=A0ABU1TZJ7_9BACL|nr:thiol-disulfide oxidoreductase ResA [Fictibacillus barbaricus]MDR7072590.1 peroxiredoxin [Fictibacillus barbaricus]